MKTTNGQLNIPHKSLASQRPVNKIAKASKKYVCYGKDLYEEETKGNSGDNEGYKSTRPSKG